jgi:hypothetical protein
MVSASVVRPERIRDRHEDTSHAEVEARRATPKVRVEEPALA